MPKCEDAVRSSAPSTEPSENGRCTFLKSSIGLMSGLLRTSIILHLIAVAAVWSVAFLLMNDASAALITTLVALLAVHILYIAYLTNAHDLVLTKVQYFVTLCMTFTVMLMLLFAYSRSAASVSGSGWETFKPIFLWLALATVLSIYVDFAIASFLRGSR
jgi:hypothetical protein